MGYKVIRNPDGSVKLVKEDEADIAPSNTERSWFKKSSSNSLFDTIGGTVQDARENLLSGLLGIGESVVDTGAYVAGSLNNLAPVKRTPADDMQSLAVTNEKLNSGIEKPNSKKQFASEMQEFISKDLYDEKEVAKKIIGATTFDFMEYDTEKDSVLGEKTEGLLQSAGQLLGTVGLQSAGVPWYVTSGVTSFGGAVEEASKEGASFGKSGLSAAISAGAELLSEKLFGGSALGEKGLVNLEFFTKGISNKVAKAIAAYGIDVASEAGEEVFSQIIGNLASMLYNDKSLKEALISEEAIDGYIESAIGGAVLSGVSNFGKMVSSAKNKTDYYTGLNKNEETVVDKVYNDRISEKEQSGEKLSTKDKAKIRAEVMEDLRSGKFGVNNDVAEQQTATMAGEEVQKEYLSLEDFANRDSSVWRNVDYNDKATQSNIMQNTHTTMVNDGSVVKVSEDTTNNVEQSYPDLRGLKKQERTPLLKAAMNKLKTNLRQFLSGFKNQNFDFEVNGKVLEARLYNTGINEVLEKVTKEKASMLYATGDIFRNARYLYSMPDYDGNPNVYRWNYFYTPVQIGDSIVGVRVAVRDVMQGQEHQPESQIYNWGIKKDASLGGVQPIVTDSSHVASSDTSDDIIPQNSQKSSGLEKKSLSSEETSGSGQMSMSEKAKTKTVTEDVAPAKDEKIAKVIIDEPAVQEKPSRTVSQARTLLVDKQSPIEDLSIKTGNRELMAKSDYLHRVKPAAQRFINKGADGTRALNDIRKEVQKSGREQEFQDYLYHALNIDRMSLKTRAEAKVAGLTEKFGKLTPEQIYAIASEPITKDTKPKRVQTIKEAQAYRDALETKNKPVFSDSITADMSRTEVEIAEKKHPEFKRWARELYDITDHLRDMMVDAGVISQETADLFAEMYPHYIPVRRLDKGGPAVTVPLDTNKTGVNAPIKRATGGNSNIGNVFKTLAQRIEQTYTAVAKNSLGIELKNSLGVEGVKKSATVDEINDNFENHDELLKKGENGLSPTFTVFENGERVEFEISEDIFDALKPTNEILAKEIKPFSIFSKIQRGLLTQYNLLFTATNAIKDAQSVLLNSQHAAKTYASMPRAVMELAQSAITQQESQYLKEYREHGGDGTLRFDSKKNEFIEDSKGVKKALGIPLKTISNMNEFIETIPRLAEYIASRENGATIEVAMLDAARVTTNFAAGGDLAKFFNRNGFTFLNASIQGLNQQARNVREAIAKGKIGVLQLAAKYAVAGLPVVLFNALAWGDDEEYEELPDYIKDGYYIIGKVGDTFIRIPKGREVAVIQNVCEQMKDQITGDDNFDFARFTKLFLENLAPQSPIDNNVIAPFIQTHTNKTWYGEELVPTRLEDLPNEEQFDESTDALSKWLGDVFDLSPYRLNYLIGQLSGGVGDIFMPMMTPKAESGDDSFVGNMIAPFKDKFTTNATVNNKNVGDFYDKVDDLTKKANSSKATDEDTLKYKYMNTIKSQMNELYQAKRELQNSDISNEEKHKRSMEIQSQIVDMMRNALDSYEDVSIDGVYATVGGIAYRWHVPDEDSTAEPSWQKITDKQLAKQNEVTSALGISASEYWSKKEEYEYAYEQPQKYQIAKAVGGYDTYRSYTKALNDIKSDKDALGDTISGSRQKKVVEYINGLDADYGTKLILYRSEYKSDDRYNRQIVEYLNSRNDISRYQMTVILTELGMTITPDGKVRW